MELQLLDCSSQPSSETPSGAYMGRWSGSMSHDTNTPGDLTAHIHRQQTALAEQATYSFMDTEPIGTLHHPQAIQRLHMETPECSRRQSLPVKHQVEDDSSMQKRHGSDPGS